MQQLLSTAKLSVFFCFSVLIYYAKFLLKIFYISDKKLGWYSWLSAKNIEWQLYLCRKYCIDICDISLYQHGILICFLSFSVVPYVGAIVRIFNYYLFQISKWSLENFPILGWMKFGKANVRINLYPKH